MDCEQALPSDRADYRVHLDNCCIRILLHKGFEFLVGAADTAALVDFEFRLLAAGTKTNLSGKIDVADFQEAVIDVVVDRFLTAHQFVLMRDIDFVNRMPLLHKRCDNAVQSGDFFFTG